MTSPRHRLFAVAAALAALLALAGCGSDDGDDSAAVDPSGREWILQELNGEAVPDDAGIDLTITDDQVSGSSGCNRYMGVADLGEGSLTFESEVAQTMMACEDDVTAREQAYLDMLLSVDGWSATEEELQLLDADGTVVARFS